MFLLRSESAVHSPTNRWFICPTLVVIAMFDQTALLREEYLKRESSFGFGNDLTILLSDITQYVEDRPRIEYILGFVPDDRLLVPTETSIGFLTDFH